jgi:hypothetical protein
MRVVGRGAIRSCATQGRAGTAHVSALIGPEPAIRPYGVGMPKPRAGQLDSGTSLALPRIHADQGDKTGCLVLINGS